ncbi:MAG TPA: tetratricopeptide repeat protein [Pyrinomonadaceae bacterium]|nr:tetratricopeptide repeat protein [Pyrinomonadaceae bacterium]
MTAADEISSLIREATRLRFEQPQKARALYEKAIAWARREHFQRELIDALKGLGQIARDAGGLNQALSLYEDAVKLCREVDDALLLAHTIRHVGDIHQDMKREDLAAPCYEEALAIYRSREQTSTLDLANAVRPFALLKEHTGAIEEAKQLWSEARDLYATANVQEGVKECSRHLSILSGG